MCVHRVSFNGSLDIKFEFLLLARHLLLLLLLLVLCVLFGHFSLLCTYKLCRSCMDWRFLCVCVCVLPTFFSRVIQFNEHFFLFRAMIRRVKKERQIELYAAHNTITRKMKTTRRTTKVQTHNTHIGRERWRGDKGHAMLECESLGNNQQTNH